MKKMDKAYLDTLFFEQKSLTDAAIDRGAGESYFESLGVDHEDAIEFWGEYAMSNFSEFFTDPFGAIVAIATRAFMLGVAAGRDRDHDPRGAES